MKTETTGFGKVVANRRASAADSILNSAETGRNLGRAGMDMAAANNDAMLRAAQKLALKLGEDGPITVDDVTRGLAADGYNVMPRKGGKRQSWKGKIFPIRSWVKIGDLPSTIQSSHGRPVGQWATKKWLKVNSLNGCVSRVSAYALIRIYNDFKRVHERAITAGVTKLEACNWFIGDEKLDPNVRKDIVADGNTLYGIPVLFVLCAVGAMLLPPDPGAKLKQTENVARHE